jgi:hypothetical protein
LTKQDRFLSTAAAIANVILIAGAAGSTLAFLYFFYEYTWTGRRQFGSAIGVVVYYVGPAALAILLCAALRLKRDHRINLAVLCVALILSLYAGELVLEIMEPALSRSGVPVMVTVHASDDRERMAVRLAKEFGVKIDTRDNLQVLDDLRATGVDAVPSVIPRFQLRYQKEDPTAPRLIAFGGISNKLTTLCNESGQVVTYDADEHGFRNPKGLWQSRQIDVVALGDSFTQGYCVPGGKNFVDIVRQQYPATLNLGMAGEGPLLMLASLKEYARPLRPRVVLWFYFEGNDLVDLQDEQTSALLMRYLQEGFSQGLRDRQPEVDRILLSLVEKEKAREIERRAARKRNRRSMAGQIVDFAKLPVLRSKLSLIQGKTPEETELTAKVNVKTDVFRRILSDAKASVASWNGRLYFVYLPNWTRFDPNRQAFEQRLAEGQRDKVLEVARDLEIPVVDVLPAFERERDPMALFPFRAPGHYTEHGHRLVGEQVVKAVVVKGVADGTPSIR